MRHGRPRPHQYHCVQQHRRRHVVYSAMPGGRHNISNEGKTSVFITTTARSLPTERSRDVTTDDGSTDILSWVGLNTDFDWIGMWSFIRDFKILAGIAAVAALSFIVVYGMLKFNPGMRVYKLVARTVITATLLSLVAGSPTDEMPATTSQIRANL